VQRTQRPDSFGLFFLTVPTARVRLGGAAEITVSATAQQSRRWVAVNPYKDVLVAEQVE